MKCVPGSAPVPAATTIKCEAWQITVNYRGEMIGKFFQDAL